MPPFFPSFFFLFQNVSTPHPPPPTQRYRSRHVSGLIRPAFSFSMTDYFRKPQVTDLAPPSPPPFPPQGPLLPFFRRPPSAFFSSLRYLVSNPPFDVNCEHSVCSPISVYDCEYFFLPPSFSRMGFSLAIPGEHGVPPGVFFFFFFGPLTCPKFPLPVGQLDNGQRGMIPLFDVPHPGSDSPEGTFNFPYRFSIFLCYCCVPLMRLTLTPWEPPLALFCLRA